MTKACVVIPVYQRISDPAEILAVRRALATFRAHPVHFLCPDSFAEELLADFRFLHPAVHLQRFPDAYFRSLRSYSALLLHPEFHDRFAAFDHLLLYQPDAYVFSDQLDHWCAKGLDYVGAPWFRNFDTEGTAAQFIERAGNGGFSLRCVRTLRALMGRRLSLWQKARFRWLLARHKLRAHRPWSFQLRFFLQAKTFRELSTLICTESLPPNEDCVLALIYPRIFPDFRAATAAEAIPFAFESQPENLYALNGRTLPFGCHAWRRHSPAFWEQFIAPS
jgi:hypothetical protein